MFVGRLGVGVEDGVWVWKIGCWGVGMEDRVWM